MRAVYEHRQASCAYPYRLSLLLALYKKSVLAARTAAHAFMFFIGHIVLRPGCLINPIMQARFACPLNITIVYQRAARESMTGALYLYDVCHARFRKKKSCMNVIAPTAKKDALTSVTMNQSLMYS